MTIEELEKKDSSFNSNIFISYVNNIVKKIFNSITLNELDNVEHFLSDKVYQKIKKEIDDAKKEKKKIIYEQVNVASNISSIDLKDNYYIVNCNVTCKYYKYYLLEKDNSVEGNNDSRTTHHYHITLKKKKNATNSVVYRCLGCGASLDINDSGKCSNCGRIYDLELFDYYIESFE